MERAVEKVVPQVFNNKENGNLHGDLPSRREGDAVVETKVCSQGVEDPNLGQFDGKVAEQDEHRAVPLFLGRRDLLVLNLPLPEVWYGVDDNPGEGPAEVNNLVHGEAHYACGKSIILPPQIPRLPYKIARSSAPVQGGQNRRQSSILTAQRRSKTLS